jgi:tetratricopeptide (TPR) repeat protein
MDYPDHITLMFELKNNTPESGIPDEMLINYNNSYYVPVEVTMLSKPVYEAISYAASNYKLNREKIKFYDTREALKVYEPPTLDYKDENIPDLKDDYITNVTKDLEYIKNKSFEYYEDYYKKIISADKDDIKAKISLAILYASYDKIDLAQDILKNISDDNNSSVLNNIGNIYFLKSDYAKAIEYYDKAYKLDPYDANILVNMAKANVKLGHIEDAKLFFNKAVSIDSELSKYKEDIFKN